MGKIITTNEFFDRIYHYSPVFQQAYHQHKHDFDEIIPHVFMGEITRCFIEIYRTEGRTEPIERILQLAEDVLRVGDEQTQNIVSVSFLGNLHQAHELYDPIKRIMSDLLRQELSWYE